MDSFDLIHANDRKLLFLAGFLHVPDGIETRNTPNSAALAHCFGVSVRTAQRWIACGLPSWVRSVLIRMICGELLPPEFQRYKLRICGDGVLTQSGFIVRPRLLNLWPHLVRRLDWSVVDRLSGSASELALAPAAFQQYERAVLP